MTEHNIHHFDKSNYAVLIEADERPWNTLGDYSDWEDNSISHNGFKHEKIRSGIFNGASSLYASVCQAMDEGYEAVGDGFSRAVKHWEITVKDLASTHTFKQEVDFDSAAKHIFKEWWKPLVDSHIEYMKQVENTDRYEVFEKITETIYLKELVIFQNDNLYQRIQNCVDKTGSDWIEATTSRYVEMLEKLEVNNVTDLDNVLDLFLRGYYDTYDFENFFMIPDPDFETRLTQSLEYIYVECNQYVEWGQLGESRINFSIDTASDYDSSNCLIIAEKPECYESVLKGVNQYLEGDWYWGEVYFIVPENDLWKYEDQDDCEYDSRFEAHVINQNESCGGFESEADVIEHFDYYKEMKDVEFKPNYKKLGMTQTV